LNGPSLDYWRLCEELTVSQAAVLLVGCDPASDYSANRAYEAAKNAISNALLRDSVKGKLVPKIETDLGGAPHW
jgi:hypothetical protein